MSTKEMTTTDKLSDREIDALIAERVMGAPHECRLVGDGKSFDTALRLDYPDAAWRVKSEADAYWDRWSPNGDDRIINAPYYSTDIASAMLVVEKVRERDWRVDCISNDNIADGEWCVTLRKSETEIAEASDDLLPRAICEAALAALSAKTEKS